MTLKEALMRTVAHLKQGNIPEARLDAEYLVATAAGIPRLHLVLKASTTLSSEGECRLHQWTQQRLERRPLAYVLGEQPFMDLKLRVNPAVLIPRPETELLVEHALAYLDSVSQAIAVDVGTGSGNIALSLAKHPNVKEVHAIDISEAALSTARENAVWNRIHKPVHWHLGDLLSPLLNQHQSIDLIAANLPYIRIDEMPKLSPEVRWEPGLALDGGRDGLAYIAQLIDQAETVLRPKGLLLLEIGSEQGPGAFDLLTRPVWAKKQLFHDLAGHPRIVYAQKGALVGSLND
jgi:release factor glutamine methyltransferase